MALVYIDVDLTSTMGGRKGIGNSDYTTRRRDLRVNFYIYNVIPCIVGIIFKSHICFLKVQHFWLLFYHVYIPYFIAGIHFAGMPTSKTPKKRTHILQVCHYVIP